MVKAQWIMRFSTRFCCYQFCYQNQPHRPAIRENASFRFSIFLNACFVLFRVIRGFERILNLTLQAFDGLFSYQLFSLDAVEVNPFVAAAIEEWTVIWRLLYSKLLASVALIVIFAVSDRQQQLATQALILTASVYGCVALVSVWEALR